METLLVPLLLAVATGLIIPTIRQWLGAKINATNIGAASSLDDYILDKVMIAVSNVGEKMADAARGGADWAVVKAQAREAALDELKALIPANYQDALQKALDSGALDAMIRYAVDVRQKTAEATVQYEKDTAAKEIARHKAEQKAKGK